MTKELTELSQRIQDFMPTEERKSAEPLQETFNRAKEVYDNATVRELLTLWYIRNSSRGDGFRFYSVAKANYIAHNDLCALAAPRTEKP